MALARSTSHTTASDSTLSTAGKAAWDGAAAHTLALAGAVSGGIPYFDSTTSEASSALLAANSIVVGGGAGAAPSTPANTTLTSSLLTVPALTSVGAIIGRDGAAGTPTFAATSSPTTGIWTSQGVNTFFSSGGNNVCGIYATGVDIAATREFRWNSASNFGGNPDVGIGRQGANQVYFGPSTAFTAGTTTRYEINKAVTAIVDNTATATFTVTVPNAAHSASIRVRLTGSLGAGGAIGARESTQDAEYMINVARTAGVNAVATIGAVVGQAAAASVAGAANAAVTGALSAISGTTSATNTFTINVTIAKSGGSSDNHTCFAFAELLNAAASGVTIA